VTPYDLRVNGRAQPSEVDDAAIRFAWRLSAADEEVTVESFRVAVRHRSASGLPGPLVWGSGDVESDEVTLVYGGPELEPLSSYVWTIFLIDTEGNASEGSSTFETGLRGAWTAAWIGRDSRPWLDAEGEYADVRVGTAIARSWQTMYAHAPLQLRREFELEELPVRARLYVSAHGIYRSYLNGRRAGLDELTPGWTRYESRIEYQAYDVTDSLVAGPNVVAAQVADGWWAGNIGYNTRQHADQYGERPELIAELHLQFADGSKRVVVTDAGWTEKPGAITMADLLMGEYHDSLLATEGWLLPQFDASAWRPVELGNGSTSVLVGALADPVRVVAELPPVSLSRLATGVTIVDFGQNISGRVRFSLAGLIPGDVVEFRHGEVLEKGQLYVDNLRSAEARDVVVVGSDSSQVFEPIFTFHGFRYVEIRGIRGAVSSTAITAVVLSSDLQKAGQFHTSSSLVNKLYSNIVWGQLGNFVSVPTDCPQRDERLGWTADAQIFAPTAVLNSDVEAFLSRWLLDLNDSQSPSGNIPDVAPLPPTSSNFSTGAPGWGDAAVIVPWTLYKTYGDLDFLGRQYPAMKAWVDYVAAANPASLWTDSLGNNYGDWLSVDAQTPKLVVAGAYRIRSTDLLALAAGALGRSDDAAHYESEAARLRILFQSEFIDSAGRVTGGTQTGYLFALAWRLVSDERRAQLAQHLVDDVVKRNRRLTTGFLGVSLLCSTLAEIGRPDLAYDILLQEEFPSWGYTILHGATTIWERWDGFTLHAGFQNKEMNSFNHYSLGSVGEWLYSAVAGIEQAEDSVGYRRLRIAPQLTTRFTRVEGAFESPRGRIALSWSRVHSDYTVEVTLPPGTSAEVDLPCGQQNVASGTHLFRFSADALPADATHDDARPSRSTRSTARIES